MEKKSMIGIISDTHDNIPAIKKAVELFKKHKVDFVIHAGDVIAPATIKYFDGLKMKFIFGNCDGDRAKIEEKVSLIGGEHHGRTLEIKHLGKTIGAFHGDDVLIADKMLKKGFDYYIFGHNHTPEDKRTGKTRMLNPGGHYLGDEPGKNKLILLDVEKDKATFLEVK